MIEDSRYYMTMMLEKFLDENGLLEIFPTTKNEQKNEKEKMNLTAQKTVYGTVQYNGETLNLIQQPFIDTMILRNTEITAYFACAVDTKGQDYEIRWSIKNLNCDDESDSCDWEKYRVTPLFTKEEA